MIIQQFPKLIHFHLFTLKHDVNVKSHTTNSIPSIAFHFHTFLFDLLISNINNGSPTFIY